jgi:nucleoside-diphosphate-sugar epimerase
MPGNSHAVLPPTDRLYASDLDRVMSGAAGAFERLRNSRIFITGGTGFVGRWLLETLLWANQRMNLGASVLLLARDQGSFGREYPHLAGASEVELVEGDVRTFEFPDGPIDRVIHLAAETNTKLLNPDPEVYFDVILGGTQRVLDFVERCHATSFTFASSGAIYGTQPETVAKLHEDDPYAPLPTRTNAAYGEAKRCAEMLTYARSERAGFSATVARCFAFVGPYLPLDSGFAVGNFIRDALGSGEIVIQGDGSPRRTYLYAGDMAIWLWAISAAGGNRRPYNVGSDRAVTIAELAHMVAASAGRGASVRILGDKQRQGVGSSYVPDVSRAREELGLDVSVGLEEALDRTIAWHLNMPDPTPEGNVQ